jgi:crotonobetainyl-CoA:carnitine CoA-transferase CaiB-like acyl-CoA transferase
LGNASRHDGALSHIRICDLSGQLAGAGATRVLAAFGAQVIRIEDPVTKGLWDIVRQIGPYIEGDHGPDGGTGFINHNVEKLGITLNLRTARGKELLAELVRVSNAVTENFAAGVMERLGFGYDQLRELRPDVVYVSNCGFGQVGPYRPFKSWGPIAQAVSGLTHTSGLAGQEPAGWGYSYMDHTGGYVMAIALLAALYHQRRTGEGQWVDLSCIEAGTAMAGPTTLDEVVNGRDLRAAGAVDSNRSPSPAMAPHGIYPCRDEDSWVAVACRSDADWAALVDVIAEPWAKDGALATLAGRLAAEDQLDADLGAWTASRARDEVVDLARRAGIPAAPVTRPPERCDTDAASQAWGLWPTIAHTKHGPLRVDGLPVHLSRTDWKLGRGGPVLGEDNERVLSEVLGLTTAEIGRLAEEGVI